MNITNSCCFHQRELQGDKKTEYQHLRNNKRILMLGGFKMSKFLYSYKGRPNNEVVSYELSDAAFVKDVITLKEKEINLLSTFHDGEQHKKY